jgi:hypothetical protein
MADLKLISKTEEELQKQMAVVRTSGMISIRNLDLKILQTLYLRKDKFTLKIQCLASTKKNKTSKGGGGQKRTYRTEESEGIQY